MQKIENPSPEQMRAFLEGSQELGFHAEGRAAIYAWVERTLKQQRYTKLSRETKGLVRRFVAKMTGLSRAQLTPYGPKTRSAASQGQPRVALRIPMMPKLRDLRVGECPGNSTDQTGDAKIVDTAHTSGAPAVHD